MRNYLLFRRDVMRWLAFILLGTLGLICYRGNSAVAQDENAVWETRKAAIATQDGSGPVVEPIYSNAAFAQAGFDFQVAKVTKRRDVDDWSIICEDALTALGDNFKCSLGQHKISRNDKNVWLILGLVGDSSRTGLLLQFLKPRFEGSVNDLVLRIDGVPIGRVVRGVCITEKKECFYQVPLTKDVLKLMLQGKVMYASMSTSKNEIRRFRINLTSFILALEQWFRFEPGLIATTLEAAQKKEISIAEQQKMMLHFNRMVKRLAKSD